MQTSKTRSGSSDMPQKTSPITPRSARQAKVAVPVSDSATSRRLATRTTTEKSPKLIDHRSPKGPSSEKKRVSRLSELESQLIQAQEDLKKTKDLLSSSESCKTKALEEADEAKKQFSAMAANFEDTKHQLLELSASEDAQVQELRKLSQERDRSWQSELEALQKQNSVDSAALASAMNEIQELKLQIEMVVESEAGQATQAQVAHTELQVLKQDMVETISLVGTLRTELNDYEKSEAEYEELLSETEMQLQVANATIETLHSDGLEVMESFRSVCVQLETSKTRVNALEGNVNAMHLEMEYLRSALKEAEIKLKEEQDKSTIQIRSAEDVASTLQSEVEQLKSALEAAETRLQEEQMKSMMDVLSACELGDLSRIESGAKEAEQELALKEYKTCIEELKAHLFDKGTELRRILDLNERLNKEIDNLRTNLTETELESKLKLSMAEVAELKSKLMDKETELKANLMDRKTELLRILDVNERLKEEMERLRVNPTESELESKLEMSMTEVMELKANLMDKETELQGISEENMVLKEEMHRREEEMRKSSESVAGELEAVRASEQVAVMKLGHANEEADKNIRKAARVAEQLESAQATNSEMEAELRRLRIQSEQWRKAAEAAASILATGNNGKLMERSGSKDSDYLHFGGKLLSSPYSDDMDDESLKKKKNNVLKKLGVLWKKGPK